MQSRSNKKTEIKLGKSKAPSVFEKMSTKVSRAAGSTSGFAMAIGVILTWLITGPLFGFSDTWQLVINTGTTVITFLMVFLIQRSQNKDFLAFHLKLNELIIAQNLASNRLVAIEEISEDDLKVLQKFYKHLADLAQNELSIEDSHSLNNAAVHHKRKSTAAKKRSDT